MQIDCRSVKYLRIRSELYEAILVYKQVGKSKMLIIINFLNRMNDVKDILMVDRNLVIFRAAEIRNDRQNAGPDQRD